MMKERQISELILRHKLLKKKVYRNTRYSRTYQKRCENL